MRSLPADPGQDSLDQAPLADVITDVLDPAWYRQRYPDIATADLDPLQHFIHYGLAERRDPNSFFDGLWYAEHYPDVTASGLNPLLHYLQAGAAELRNPHPRFDAVYYVDQHPSAAANPLRYHLGIGLARGYLTEQPIDIRDYLPSENPPLSVPRGVFADIVIPVRHGSEATGRCIRSVLADRTLGLGRIIIIDDGATKALGSWLRDLAAEGQVHLIRNRRRLGFAGSANLGIDVAEGHDVVVLNSNTEVPPGWLRRLIAHAYSQPNIATVSPLFDRAAICGYPDDECGRAETAEQIDEVCRQVNVGRSLDVPETMDHCVYIRQAALRAVGAFYASRSQAGDVARTDFCLRATAAGWRHRLACDIYVARNNDQHSLDRLQRAQQIQPDAVTPFRFAVTAALFRQSALPVILMVSHPLGGGVKRHIDELAERFRGKARVLRLEGTNRGAALSVIAIRNTPDLTLPSDRLDDLVTLLRSMNVSRIHIHHLLQMDIDIRTLVHRLDVPFDVTVHDYYAICPQINLLTWSEGMYCGEPGPAGCDACIASRSSHGARDIVSWRRGWAWQFMDADRVICPSADVKARLDRYRLGDRAIVVPHEQQKEAAWIIRRSDVVSKPLRIVLLGVLANHKGARAVAEVAEAADPATIELHLVGHLEASFPKPAAKLIKATGQYRDRDMPALLERIDPQIIWLPSSWPETYSYTLSVAIATGLPIVATNLGAFPERLAGRPQSWLLDHRASAHDWLAAFDEVRTTLRDQADRPPVSRPLMLADFYTDQYLSPAAPPPAAAVAWRNQNAGRSGRRPRIAIVPERYNAGGLTPCAYIRLLQPLDHPSVSSTFDISLTDSETVFDQVADIIVTQRYAIPDLDTADRLAEHARRTGARLLYDLDDDLLGIPGSHPDAPTLRPLAKVVRRMLTVADTVWVSTPGLAQRLAPVRPDAIVIENRLDERIWIHGPAPTPFWDDPVRILCMGTITHERDFAIIEPALRRLKSDYGDRIVIDILGMTSRRELPGGLNRIGSSTYASRSYPGFVDWLTRMQPRWHIGLAPLLDTPFNRGKSPIKAMDYAAMGLAVLASDTSVYRGSIADGPGGQLVANDHRHWHAALDWLIRDQDLRERSAVQARQAFLTRATLTSHAQTRLAALTRLLPNQVPGKGVDLRRASPASIIAHGSVDPTTRTRRHSGRRG